MGDLNCNVLTDNPENKALASFMSDVNLKQVITTPTRITESSSSLIDVIMVSHPDIIYENGVINTTISDHLPVFVRLNLRFQDLHHVTLLCAAMQTMIQSISPPI